MGFMEPVYPPEDLEKLNEKQRRVLRNAVLLELQTDRQIRRLLRKKTLHVFESLIPKRKARPRRKR